MVEQAYDALIEKLADKIAQANAIVVGTGSVMQQACDADYYYADGGIFSHVFKSFSDAYGIKNVRDGLKFPFESPEEHWAFLATHLHIINQRPLDKPYEYLYELLQKKAFHIVTSNKDGQLLRIFDPKNVSEVLGDWGLLQCSKQCHDETYESKEIVEELYMAIDGTRVPKQLVPRCEKCGAELLPWVWNNTFLEGERYKAEYGKWEGFLLAHQDPKMLFFDIGADPDMGEVITWPFHSFTQNWDDGFYAAVTTAPQPMPVELSSMSMLVRHDICEVLGDLNNVLK